VRAQCAKKSAVAARAPASAAEAFFISLRGKLRDPELRFFTTFELAQSVQLRKILRLIWRSRRFQTVLYEIIRDGDAAERLAGGRFFRFCQ